MKIAAKSDAGRIAPPPVEVLIPSAGITAGIEVEDGKLKIKTKGRPSGQMPDGSHGDHVTAQILSAHGIRRAANGTEVAEIDDLRNVRESIFSFISSIAVLNGTRSSDTGASTSSTGIASGVHYTVNNKEVKGLYARMNQILDVYNAERYKHTNLKVLEGIGKYADNILLKLPEELKEVIDNCGGFQSFFGSYIEQNRASNRRLICDTFARLIEATSTYYYKIPNTAYSKIPKYEASEAEGGNVNAALSILDAVCERLTKERNLETNYGHVKRSATKKTLADIAKIQAEEEVSKKEVVLKKEIFPEKQQTLSVQIDKLSKCYAKGEDALSYIALKLKDLFHYPQIGDDVAAEAMGVRTNIKEEFYDKVAKHLFIVFNVYPELAYSAEDKDRIVNLFLTEVINYKTNMGVEQG